MMHMVYNLLTGKLIKSVIAPDNQLPLQYDSKTEGLIEVESHVDGDMYYVDAEIIKLRHDYVLESLPLPCTVTIEGIEYRCTEQPVFEFDAPGTYTIRVIPESAAFLEKEFTYAYQP